MNKLLVFTENYVRGGGNRYMIDLVNALQEQYREILIFSNKGGIFSEDIFRLYRPALLGNSFFITRGSVVNSIQNFPIVLRKLISTSLIVLEPIFLICNIALFMVLLLKVKPTHILACNGGYPAAQACLAMVIAAWLIKIPVVLSICSMPSPRRVTLWLYDKFLDKLVWAGVNLIVTNAKAISEALLIQREALPNKLKIIYNGLDDVSTFQAPKIDRDEFIIGCVARMDVSKGVFYLLDAFSILVRMNPNMRLVLVGHGNASEQLAKQIKFLGLENKVELAGHYNGDINALLSTFNVFVFPSLWEGFPYSIIEALRSGCVIVSTDVGGIPEAITDRVEGLLINPRSRDDIVSALQELISNQKLCNTLSKNARKKFESKLTLSKMHNNVRKIFAELGKVN